MNTTVGHEFIENVRRSSELPGTEDNENSLWDQETLPPFSSEPEQGHPFQDPSLPPTIPASGSKQAMKRASVPKAPRVPRL